MLVLLGIARDDSEQDLLWLSGKIALMRIFEDPDGRMNLSLADSGGGALVVSQFTLHASTRKGNRPSFLGAAPPDQAALLYDGFCRALSARLRCPVGRGRFGAAMSVSLVNEGPVTIFMDSKNPE